MSLVVVIASDVNHDAPRQLSDSVEPRFNVFVTFKEPLQLLIAGELTWKNSIHVQSNHVHVIQTCLPECVLSDELYCQALPCSLQN